MERKWIENYLVYSFIIIILLILGYIYEKPYGVRQYILIVLTIMAIIFLLTQKIFTKKFYQYTCMIFFILSMVGIERYSKYAVNYFYHFIYIVFMLYILLNYKRINSIYISLFLLISSFIKFLTLLSIQFNQANLSLFLFFLTIQILIFAIAYLVRVYRKESKRNKQLYSELKKYSEKIQQLTASQERTKIARDLHDTLGHDMTALIMQIEMASRSKDNKELLNQRLDDAKCSARDSLVKIRQIVGALKSDTQNIWALQSIKTLVDDFSKKTNVNVSLTMVEGQKVAPNTGITLYRIIQESLTNAVRHGKANDIQIQINFSGDKIYFKIKDNGKGCEHLINGNGLQGMVERITLLKGEIEFRDKKGFEIEGWLPNEGGEV